MSFDLSDYVDVAERLKEFFTRYPKGSLQGNGEFVRDEQGRIVGYVYRASAYRSPDDGIPAVGTAYEPIPGRTPYTKDSEVQNAETSAWGRAIVAAGFETKKVASADEVRNRRESGNPAEKAQEAYEATGGYEPFSQYRPNMTGDLFYWLAERAESADAKPSQVVVHFGKMKGVMLGEMTKEQVKWWAEEWKMQEDPSPYDHRLRQAAVALAAGNDVASALDPYPLLT